MSKLQEWIDEAEEVEIDEDLGCVRVHTDEILSFKAHGFYVQIYADGGGLTMDGEELDTPEDMESGKEFLINCRHGYDGPIDEFNRIMGISA